MKHQGGRLDESDQVDPSNESGQRRVVSLESEEGDLFEVDRQLQLDEARRIALRFGRRVNGAAVSLNELIELSELRSRKSKEERE